MLDINLLRTNPELVKENIRKKFQDEKLVMVDEVVEMDKEYRAAIQQADTLRNQIKVASKQIGMLMGKGQKEEAEKAKEQVAVYKADLEGLAAKEDELQAEIRKRMLVIPNIIDPSVPIGKDDSQNVEIERFGEPVVPDFEIPYHVDIMERLHGIDLDSARRTSGNGFYYLMGDIARLHSAILSYGRDFMIDRGFTYCIPPYMIHGDVVDGRDELRRDGEHDVQDRGRRPLSDWYVRALHDRQVHRHDSGRKPAAADADQLFPLLPQGSWRAWH